MNQTIRNLLLLCPRDGIRWLLRDEFSDTRAAGAVNGTPATPGPGTRVVVDTDGDALSISGGQLHFANSNGVWGDPGYWLDPLTRTAGRTVFIRLTPSANNTMFNAGFDTDQLSDLRGPGEKFDNTAAIEGTRYWAMLPDFGSYIATTYTVAIVQRLYGALFFIKGGAYTNWTLLYLAEYNNITPLYPAISNLSATFSADFVRVPENLIIPQPIASDSFNRANGVLGTTDGAGTTDGTGTARAAETGGAGLAWTVQSGVWAISGNKAVATTAGIATLPSLATPDVIMDCKLTTPAAGTTKAGIMLRYTDADNWWYLALAPGTAGNDLFLMKRAVGVTTTEAAADVDWAAATTYFLRVIVAGAQWNVYSGTTEPDTLRLSLVDAFNQAVPVFGIRDEGNSNVQFDSVSIWERNPYSCLDRYAP